MKHLILLFTLLLISPVFLVAQDEDDDNYVMFETLVITPDYENIVELEEAMANHNKKYHSEGPTRVNVYAINSGPNVGKWVWVMGPCMFRHFDERMADDSHGKDWRNNVLPHVEKLEHGEYWSMNEKLSTVQPLGDDRGPYPILFVRYNEINEDNIYQMDDFHGKVSEVMKQLQQPWGLFYNMFQQGDIGRHVAGITYYDNWKEFDEGFNFKKVYEEINGEDSWTDFRSQIDHLFDNTWDEMWIHVPELSGGNE